MSERHVYAGRELELEASADSSDGTKRDTTQKSAATAAY